MYNEINIRASLRKGDRSDMKFIRVRNVISDASYYWHHLILFALFCFYILYFGLLVWKGAFPFQYGEDFLAYWSAGRLAGEQGYSNIYDLTALKTVQTTALHDLGRAIEVDDPSIPVMPAPILSAFVLPFQFFSPLDPETGYWVWTGINLLLLVGYLIFFVRKLTQADMPREDFQALLLPYLLFFPVMSNLIQGQINVFLMIFMGEFIRNSVSNKPMAAGLWLGGLLIKPQLLILIVPVILILRYKKVIYGFLLSSGVIIAASALLSGGSGMRSLLELWFSYSGESFSAAPANMINWRMVGFDINSLFQISGGWIVTGLGILLTAIALIVLVKKAPAFGSSRWVVTILGVFSATLAITWHAHYAMALVLIPLLIYVSVNKLIPDTTSLKWIVATPALILLMIFGGVVIFLVTKRQIILFDGAIIGVSGLIVMMAILFSAVRNSRQNADKG